MSLIQGLGAVPALALSPADILGTWQYDGFLYAGHRYPNPNPDLELFFTFDTDGKSRLFWQRKNENVFCERVAEYRVFENRLTQKVIWVNPANAPECARDVDMQPGRESEIEVRIQGVDLVFLFDLDGKPFLYILKPAVVTDAFYSNGNSSPCWGASQSQPKVSVNRSHRLRAALVSPCVTKTFLGFAPVGVSHSTISP